MTHDHKAAKKTASANQCGNYEADNLAACYLDLERQLEAERDALNRAYNELGQLKDDLRAERKAREEAQHMLLSANPSDWTYKLRAEAAERQRDEIEAQTIERCQGIVRRNYHMFATLAAAESLASALPNVAAEQSEQSVQAPSGGQPQESAPAAAPTQEKQP